MRFLKYILLNLFLLTACITNVQADSHDSALVKAMQDGGHILMIRHANAPGFGDPDNFKIGDCSTQRNLDGQGRQQAVKIGDWLRSNNIEAEAVYSSQWCRCLETARLLDMGTVSEMPPLNSFYQMSQNRKPSLDALKQFIAEQAVDNKLIIMTTHHVTIAAIAGKNVSPGNGVLLKLNESAPYEFVGVVRSGKAN